MIEERLDRSLANSEWLQLFPIAKLLNLIATHSDHSPILLCCDPLLHRHKRKQFKFENWWLKEDGVEQVVSDGRSAEGYHNVTERIAKGASDLKSWNRSR